MRICVYNAQHTNHDASLLFSANDGRLSITRASGKCQVIWSLEEFPVFTGLIYSHGKRQLFLQIALIS